MVLKEQHIRNIFIYVAPRFLGYAISLVTLPILTRLLTPQDFGIAALVTVCPLLAVSILTMGLVSAAQRYYFEYRKDDRKLKAFLFSVQLFLYASLFISIFGAFFLKDIISQLVIKSDKYGWAIFIAFITAFLAQIFNLYLYLYQNMEKAKVHSVFVLSRMLITAIVTLLLVWYFKLSYMGILYGSLFGTVSICLIMAFHFNRKLNPVFNSRILFENIKYGLQLLPRTFTGYIMRFFDKFMINSMLSLSAVGVYNIGQSLGNTMFLLMNTTWSSFQPVCYREAFDGGEKGGIAVGKIFTIFVYFVLTPVFLLILFAEELIWLIAPPSYYGAIDIIMIILGGIATQTFGMYVGVQYAYSKKPYLIFPATTIGMIINVIANIVLIPRFGIIGAGVAIVIAYLIQNGILVFVGQRLYRIQYEWGRIISLYAVIAFTLGAVFFLRYTGTQGLLFYLSKMLIIALFLFTCIRNGLLNKNSMRFLIRSVAVKKGQ